MPNRHSAGSVSRSYPPQTQYNAVVGFGHNCARCGSTTLTVNYRDRKSVLPTCTCKEDTLNHMLNVILAVLEETITEPRAQAAKRELAEFIEEFGEWTE